MDLEGATVVFTGPLTTMHRDEAWALVTACGGTPEAGLTRRTDVLIVGGLYRPHWVRTRKLTRAAALGVAVIDEAEFLRCLPQHLAPPVDGVLFGSETE